MGPHGAIPPGGVSFSDSPSFKLIHRRNDAHDSHHSPHHQEVVSEEMKGTVKLRGAEWERWEEAQHMPITAVSVG